MDDRPIPPPVPAAISNLVRSCEASRMQRQFLAQAYQRLCPEIRLRLETSLTVDARSPSTAARAAAGA